MRLFRESTDMVFMSTGLFFIYSATCKVAEVMQCILVMMVALKLHVKLITPFLKTRFEQRSDLL